MGKIIANVEIKIPSNKWDSEEMKQSFIKNLTDFISYGLIDHATLFGTEVILKELNYQEDE